MVPIDDGGDEVLQFLVFGFILGRVEEGGEHGSAAGDQRAACPPDVEGGDVAVADGLLARRLNGNLKQGEVDFDETAVVGRRLSFRRWSLAEACNLRKASRLSVMQN